MNSEEFKSIMHPLVKKLHDSENNVPQSLKQNKVSVWLPSQSPDYRGEGSLISFIYVSKQSPTTTINYALTDEQVLVFLLHIITTIGSGIGYLGNALHYSAYLQLSMDYEGNDLDMDDWDISIQIKGYYGSMTSEEYDMSHLRLSEKLTLENLDGDIAEMRMRGINLAQLTAEECLVMLKHEKMLFRNGGQ